VPAVLAHRCDWDGATVIALHNFAPEPCRVRIRLDAEEDGDADAVALQDLLDGGYHEIDDPSEVTLELDRYGYRWLRLLRRGQRRMP